MKEEGKYRLFRPYSRPISAVSGKFRPYCPLADTTQNGRYGLILAELARFSSNRSRFGTNWAASARIEPSRCESEEKKKKNLDADRRAGNRVGRRVPRRATSDAGAAPLVLHPCFLGIQLDVMHKEQPEKERSKRKEEMQQMMLQMRAMLAKLSTHAFFTTFSSTKKLNVTKLNLLQCVGRKFVLLYSFLAILYKRCYVMLIWCPWYI